MEELDTDPLGVTTCILPEFPAPTVNTISDEELTVYEVTAVPPIVTEVVPVKLVPDNVTVDPEHPEDGV